MRQILARIKPATGFSRAIYITLNIFLPLLVFALVRMHFVQLALAIILLSKWRMFAVRPRFWPAHIRANAVDIIVGVSLLSLMVQYDSQLAQVILTVGYAGWQVFIKPASSMIMISIQATIGMLAGLMALFTGWGDGALYVLVPATGLICYLVARHFFDSFDEGYARLLSYLWGYFGAGLVWVLGHWLIFYGIVAQPVIILLALGYGLATLYYLDHHDRLSGLVRKQFVFIMVAIMVVMMVSLVLSGHNKIV
jgi:hypothetical protein